MIKTLIVATALTLILVVCLATQTVAHAAGLGSLSATQVVCSDLGAQVKLSVTGGLPSTSYAASAAHSNGGPTTFMTNSVGDGQGILYNVRSDTGSTAGLATISVTAGGQSGHTTLNLTCSGGKG